MAKLEVEYSNLNLTIEITSAKLDYFSCILDPVVH
jgi:hypothetical protein